MTNPNLDAVYSALYNKCEHCWGDPTIKSNPAGLVALFPPRDDELVGWVTNPKNAIYCDYCTRLMKQNHNVRS